MCTYFDNFPLTSATKCLQCKKCMLLKFGSPLDPHTNLGPSNLGHISSYVKWLENRDLNDPRVLVSNSLLPETVTHVLYPSEKIIIICLFRGNTSLDMFIQRERIIVHFISGWEGMVQRPCSVCILLVYDHSNRRHFRRKLWRFSHLPWKS